MPRSAATTRRRSSSGSLDPASLVAGENILSVEVHQASSTSSDLGFDMVLRGIRADPPAGTTSQWSMVSGPGTASFSDAASPASAVSFDQAGTYVLRLEAVHAGVSYSDEVTVTVDPVPDFAVWIAGFPVSDIDALGGPGPGRMEQPVGVRHRHAIRRAGAVMPPRPSPVIRPMPRRCCFPTVACGRWTRPMPSGSPAMATACMASTTRWKFRATSSTWQAAASALTMQAEGAPGDNGDGSETVTVRSIPSSNNDPALFVRLRVVME